MKQKFTKEQYDEVVCLMDKIKQQLEKQIENEDSQGEHEIDPWQAHRSIKKLLPVPNKNMRKYTTLRRVFQKETFIIDACSGKKTFLNEEEVFNHLNTEIYPAEKRKGASTQKTEIKISKTGGRATYGDVYLPLIPTEEGLSGLCLTEHQILVFYQKQYHRLRRGITVFLKKVGDIFFVVRIFESDGQLYVREDRLRIDSKTFLPSGVYVVIPILLVNEKGVKI